MVEERAEGKGSLVGSERNYAKKLNILKSKKG